MNLPKRELDLKSPEIRLCVSLLSLGDSLGYFWWQDPPRWFLRTIAEIMRVASIERSELFDRLFKKPHHLRDDVEECYVTCEGFLICMGIIPTKRRPEDGSIWVQWPDLDLVAEEFSIPPRSGVLECILNRNALEMKGFSPQGPLSDFLNGLDFTTTQFPTRAAEFIDSGPYMCPFPYNAIIGTLQLVASLPRVPLVMDCSDPRCHRCFLLTNRRWRYCESHRHPGHDSHKQSASVMVRQRAARDSAQEYGGQQDILDRRAARAKKRYHEMRPGAKTRKSYRRRPRWLDDDEVIARDE